MKPIRKNSDPTPASAPFASIAWWWAPLLALLAFAVYYPALRGPFLFDDLSLPFLDPKYAGTLTQFFTRGLRALTNTSFHLDHSLFGLNPTPYHVENLLLHLANALLAFFLLRRILRLAGRLNDSAAWTALFGAALFLLHPLQTEAVSYIASRSEVLCVLFSYAALAVYFYSPHPLAWSRALSILALTAAGILSKEPAVALVGVFLAADLLFAEEGFFARVKANWRLYAPLAAGALAVGARFYLIASTEGTAGQGFSRVSYLLTQFQAIWIYVRLFFLPIGQNLDHAMPWVQAPGSALSWLGLAGLLAALAAAFVFRKRAPLAALGIAIFLLLLAPTSSIVPIADALVERRVYFASLGLLLVLAEGLTRLPFNTAVKGALAAVVLLFSWGTYARNSVYETSNAIWEDALRGNPDNARAHFQLAYALYSESRCTESLHHFEQAARLQKPDDRLLVDWGYALDCSGDLPQATEKIRQASAISSDSNVWAALGMMYAKQNQLDQALEALNHALRLRARNDLALAYRGNVYSLLGRPAEARADFDEALRINPANQVAQQGRASLH